IAVITSTYFNAQHRTTDMGERLLAAAASRAGQQLFVDSKQAESLVREIAGLSDHGLRLDDSDALVNQLLVFLRANPTIAWISYSDTAGTFTDDYRDAAARTCTNQSHIVAGKPQLVEYHAPLDAPRTLIRQSNDSKYDPRTRPFYRSAVTANDV